MILTSRRSGLNGTARLFISVGGDTPQTLLNETTWGPISGVNKRGCQVQRFLDLVDFDVELSLVSANAAAENSSGGASGSAHAGRRLPAT